jgi:predicted transcriptional regulator
MKAHAWCKKTGKRLGFHLTPVYLHILVICHIEPWISQYQLTGLLKSLGTGITRTTLQSHIKHLMQHGYLNHIIKGGKTKTYATTLEGHNFLIAAEKGIRSQHLTKVKEKQYRSKKVLEYYHRKRAIMRQSPSPGNTTHPE